MATKKQPAKSRKASAPIKKKAPHKGRSRTRIDRTAVAAALRTPPRYRGQEIKPFYGRSQREIEIMWLAAMFDVLTQPSLQKIEFTSLLYECVQAEEGPIAHVRQLIEKDRLRERLRFAGQRRGVSWRSLRGRRATPIRDRIETALTQTVMADAAFAAEGRHFVRDATVQELERVVGVGPITARTFILHTRPDARVIVLDRNMRKVARSTYRITSLPPFKKKKDLSKCEYAAGEQSLLATLFKENKRVIERDYSGNFGAFLYDFHAEVAEGREIQRAQRGVQRRTRRPAPDDSSGNNGSAAGPDEPIYG